MLQQGMEARLDPETSAVAVVEASSSDPHSKSSSALEQQEPEGTETSSSFGEEEGEEEEDSSLSEDDSSSNNTAEAAETNTAATTTTATTTTVTTPKPKIEKHCRFGTVDVAFYFMTLGSNPGGSEGAPVELGEFMQQETFESVTAAQQALHPNDDDNDDLDKHRPAVRLDKERRRKIVEQAGFDDLIIARAVRDTYHCRLSRLRASREDEAAELLREENNQLQERLSPKSSATAASANDKAKKRGLFSMLRGKFQR